jgi:hypothetical protein
MFKEKCSKKKNNNNDIKDSITLDAMHNNMIKKFVSNNIEKNENILLLKNYNNTYNKLLLEIEAIKNTDNKELYNNLWSSNIKLKEQIININNKLKEYENFDEIDYYNNTSDILFKYYEMIDRQSSINIPNIPVLIPSTNIEMKHKSFNVLDALNKNIIDKKTTINSNQSLQSLQPIHNNNDKSKLVDEYLSIINKQHIKKIEQDDIEICKVCKSSMICYQHDAIMICNECGYQELLLVEQNRPILKQNTKDTSHFSYKRINHFREWCNQVQGKESTDIPDEIFEKILNEIKKEKILDTKTITYNKMREILKRLRINKYYEHINYIINRINGIPTPQFSPELEDKLCNMFRNIQVPFLKHCPKDRKNFLSYSYVLYKFFQILGLDEYLKYFPLLKSREKLYVQDQIWKKICEELNYDIIPSL